MEPQFDPRVTPWQIDESEFYRLRSAEARIQFLLRYSILAPSGHNTQPWRFEAGPNGALVFADYSRRLPEADPDNRELLMSIGAAIFNLRVAAAHFGYHCAVLYTPRARTPYLAATIDLFPAIETDRTDGELKRLFPAIQRRRTNRQGLQPRQISAAELQRLGNVSRSEKACIRLITAAGLRNRVAQLVSVGDRMQFANEDYRKEMAGWLRTSATSEGDGLVGDALGIPPLLSPTAPWFVRHFDFGSSVSNHTYQITAAAPALAVVEAEDDPASLLEAGELLEGFLLTLTSMGIQYSFVNQAVAIPGLRVQLRHMLKQRMQPQLILRIGYGAELKRATPRRTVDEVVQRQPV